MRLSLLQKPVLSAPSGVDPKGYYLCLLGPIALALSAGIQVTMTAFLLLGPAGDTGMAGQLTEYGKTIARPEHDLLIYVAGAAFTLFMAWVMVWYWRSELAAIKASKVAEFMIATALLEAVLAMFSLIVYVLLLCSSWSSLDFQAMPSLRRPPTNELDALILLVPCLVALVCAAIDLEYGFDQSAASASRFELRRLRLGKVLRYAVPLFIILVLGVPPGTWRYLAGQVFLIDKGLHLNFFFMGPALSFAHGKAFGTEIYSLYGIGWPLLASTLSHFSALTYGNLIGVEIVYGCVYYLALFFLLRSCFKQEIWAAFGVVLAIYWQIFSGMHQTEVIWQYPSSTLMRHPLDVWFFFTLVMHQRSGKILWAVLAGLAAALAVFFETETGGYLLVTFLIYSVLQAGLASGERPAGGVKGWLLPPLAFYSTVAVTLLPLLLYASRGTLFTGAFGRGWLEALLRYPSLGIDSLPIAEVPDVPLTIFMSVVTVYLGVVVCTVIRGLHGSAGKGEVLLATVAAYGMALLLVFVNRSHPFNLCHAMVPFAVVFTALAFQGYRALEGRLPRSVLPYALLGGLVVLLLTKTQFQRYPSFLGSIFAESPTGGVSLRSNPPDISGLPPDYEYFVREFQAVNSAIQLLAPDGKDVAILDPDDTLLYQAANVRPWSRYASLFQMIFTQQALDDIRNDLLLRSPRYVVIRGQNAFRPPDWDFVWAPLYEVVTNRYVLRQTVGPYEIWRRANHS